MTRVLDMKEVAKELGKEGFSLEVSRASSKTGESKATSMSGKALAERLSGLLTSEQAEELERHIDQSCEQGDD